MSNTVKNIKEKEENTKIKAENQALKKKNATLTEENDRLTHILVKTCDTCEEKDTQIEELESKVARYTQKLEEKDIHIEDLESKNTRYTQKLWDKTQKNKRFVKLLEEKDEIIDELKENTNRLVDELVEDDKSEEDTAHDEPEFEEQPTQVETVEQQVDGGEQSDDDGDIEILPTPVKDFEEITLEEEDTEPSEGETSKRKAESTETNITPAKKLKQDESGKEKSPAPKISPGPEKSPASKKAMDKATETRVKVTKGLNEALTGGRGNIQLYPGRVLDIAKKIERAMNKSLGGVGKKYMSKYRCLVQNLQTNPSLQERVVGGLVGPAALVDMQVQDYAGEDLQRWRLDRKERANEAILTQEVERRVDPPRVVRVVEGEVGVQGGQADAEELNLLEELDTDSKAFACNHCTKAFKSVAQLNLHKDFVHTDNDPIFCPKCDRNFLKKASLEEHMKGHNKP